MLYLQQHCKSSFICFEIGIAQKIKIHVEKPTTFFTTFKIIDFIIVLKHGILQITMFFFVSSEHAHTLFSLKSFSKDALENLIFS